MGQEARAEEENAKMPNSWMALEGDLANSGLRRAWLNYCGPLLRQSPGSLMEGFAAGAVAPSGSSGSSWRSNLTTHSVFEYADQPRSCVTRGRYENWHHGFSPPL
jgi:hypothetical protein